MKKPTQNNMNDSFGKGFHVLKDHVLCDSLLLNIAIVTRKMVPLQGERAHSLYFLYTNRRLRNEQEGGGDRTRTTVHQVTARLLHYYT